MVDEQIQNEVLGKLIDVSMDTSDPKISGKLKGVLKLVRCFEFYVICFLSECYKCAGRYTTVYLLI